MGTVEESEKPKTAKAKSTAAGKTAAKTKKTTTKTSKTTKPAAKKKTAKPAQDWKKDIKSDIPASNFITQMIFDRIMHKVEVSQMLPWMKPFISPSMNYVTEREYTGINKMMLDGGEYMTNKQIKDFNAAQEKKDLPQYWYGRGTKIESVVFYKKEKKEVTAAEVEAAKKNPVGWKKYVQEDGVWYCERSILSYTDVINIVYIKNAEGEPLPSKIGTDIFETYTDAEDIIRPYQAAMGIKEEVSPSGAYYTPTEDTVYLPRQGWFKHPEAYYRTMFHEYAHSTGPKSRLNRECFAKYHGSKKERSREELVAEVCAVLLASEAGFRGEGTYKNEFLEENSLNYVAGWVSWMRSNPDEVVKGIREAERAKTYILTAGKSSYEGTSASTTAETRAKELGLGV